MNNQRLANIRAQKWYHILPIKPWMMLEIHEKVWEGNNARVWKFRGLVLKVKKPNHVDGTFTIRGKTAGHTIEKIYPLSFGQFAKVILVDVYKIRRAKLYYLRDKIGKDARLKSISTQEERGVDLLALAQDEAKKLMESVTALQAEETTEEVTDAEVAVTDNMPEETSDNTSTEEVETQEQAEETQAEEVEAEQAEEESQEESEQEEQK